MSELQTLLQTRASTIEPTADALPRVLREVRRRKHRRVTAVMTSVALVGAGLAVVGVVRHSPNRPVVVASELIGSRRALQLRTELGIRGGTKGAPNSVVVSTPTRSGGVKFSLVEVPSGKSVPLPSGAGSNASVSPKGDVVVAVSDNQLVLTPTKNAANVKPVVVPNATGTTGSVSWDRGGSGLFAPVGGGWVRVSDPMGATGPRVQDLNVPPIPGGPILLSVAPRGDLVLLFGITYPEGRPPQPHLFLGTFDGTTVSNVHPVTMPAEALSGPLGWLGDNAFLLSAGPGQALIVRTDNGSLPIQAEPMTDPCSLVSSATQCTQDGPWLLGSNGDGSLLLWQVSAIVPTQAQGGAGASGSSSLSGATSGVDASGSPSDQPLLVLYYKTWLDGTHAVRLTGAVSRYGPPVAAR